MQVMYDDVRNEDEQAYIIERNSDGDVDAQEEFTLEASYKM